MTVYESVMAVRRYALIAAERSGLTAAKSRMT
jgi:hypothetical protein